MTEQPVGASASLPLTGRVDFLLALIAPVARRARALLVVALVYLGVCVTELDGDVPDQLVLETDGLDAGDGLDDGGFSVCDMADGADVDSCLSGDDLGGQRRQGADVEVLGLGLRRQRWTLDGWGRGGLFEGGLEGLLSGLGVGVVLGFDSGGFVAGVGLGLDVVPKLVAVGGHDGFTSGGGRASLSVSQDNFAPLGDDNSARLWAGGGKDSLYNGNTVELRSKASFWNERFAYDGVQAGGCEFVI